MTSSMSTKYCQTTRSAKAIHHPNCRFALNLTQIEQIFLAELIQQPPPSKKTISNPFSDLAISLFKVPL